MKKGGPSKCWTLMVLVSQKKLPPVRNKDHRAKMKKKQKSNSHSKAETSAEEASRIKAYDYRSWDKFDVVSCAFRMMFYQKAAASSGRFWLQDKALAEVDKDGGPEESHESDSEDAAVDPETALTEKEKVRLLATFLKPLQSDMDQHRHKLSFVWFIKMFYF